MRLNLNKLFLATLIFLVVPIQCFAVDAGVGGKIVHELFLLFVVWPLALILAIFFTRALPIAARILLVVAVIVLPILYDNQLKEKNRIESLQNNAHNSEKKVVADLKRLASVCNTKSMHIDPSVIQKHPPKGGLSIQVSEKWPETNFQKFLALNTQNCFLPKHTRSDCTQSNVQFIEIKAELYQWTNHPVEKLYRFQSAAENEIPVEIKARTAQYELQLGDSSTKRTYLSGDVYGPEDSITWGTVKLVRLNDKYIFATLDLAFSGGATMDGCPRTEVEISKILYAVFGSP